jgi:diguanylate cyclase (GGDEF)-like protein
MTAHPFRDTPLGSPVAREHPSRSSAPPADAASADLCDLVREHTPELVARLSESRKEPVAMWLRALCECAAGGSPSSARPSIILDRAGIPAEARLHVHERVFEAAARMLGARFAGDGARVACALVALERLLEHDARASMRTKLRDATTRDDLTHVLGRSSLMERLARAFDRGRRDDSPFSALFVDVDHFKAINDAHGHAAGDAVLRAIADVMTNELRPADVVGRYGGDEFVVGLPGADAAHARHVAERLRARVARADLGGHRVTVSIGMASANPGDHLEHVIARADAAMYAAKAAGRNSVREYRRGLPATIREPPIAD